MHADEVEPAGTLTHEFLVALPEDGEFGRSEIGGLEFHVAGVVGAVGALADLVDVVRGGALVAQAVLHLGHHQDRVGETEDDDVGIIVPVGTLGMAHVLEHRGAELTGGRIGGGVALVEGRGAALVGLVVGLDEGLDVFVAVHAAALEVERVAQEVAVLIVEGVAPDSGLVHELGTGVGGLVLAEEQGEDLFLVALVGSAENGSVVVQELEGAADDVLQGGLRGVQVGRAGSGVLADAVVGRDLRGPEVDLRLEHLGGIVAPLVRVEAAVGTEGGLGTADLILQEGHDVGSAGAGLVVLIQLVGLEQDHVFLQRNAAVGAVEHEIVVRADTVGAGEPVVAGALVKEFAVVADLLDEVVHLEDPAVIAGPVGNAGVVLGEGVAGNGLVGRGYALDGRILLEGAATDLTQHEGIAVHPAHVGHQAIVFTLDLRLVLPVVTGRSEVDRAQIQGVAAAEGNDARNGDGEKGKYLFHDVSLD